MYKIHVFQNFGQKYMSKTRTACGRSLSSAGRGTYVEKKITELVYYYENDSGAICFKCLQYLLDNKLL